MTKHYTDEFKQGAVDMVRDHNLTQVEVAKRLGTSSKNIARWVKDASGDADTKAQNDYSKRIAELEKENKRLKMERDILKKATAFFAKECS